MKLRLLALSLILLTGFSAAQSSNTSINGVPGAVKADSPIHWLDVRFDNFLRSVPMSGVSAGDIAFERASEAAVANDRNNSEASQKALNQFDDVVREADNSDKAQLEQAESVLNNVSGQVPEEASQGIETALDNVEDAKNRVPEGMTADGKGGGGVLPDIEMPDFGGGKDIKSPASSEGPTDSPAR